MIWSKDKEIFHKGKVFGTEISILKTPGHSPEHSSLVVKTKEYGIVCIAQDVFWWEDGKQKSDRLRDLLSLKDPFVTDQKALKESRKKVLEIADYIIPGHGDMFKVKKLQSNIFLFEKESLAVILFWQCRCFLRLFP